MFLLPTSRYNYKSPPFATITLVAYCSILWCVLWLMTYPPGFFNRFGFTPANPTLSGILGSTLIHSQLFFLLPNMIFLAGLGGQLEDQVGHLLFPVFFLVCGVGGTLLFYVADRESSVPFTGAAGAVCGVTTAFWILFPKQRFDVQFHLGWWHVKDFEAGTYIAGVAWFFWQLITYFVEDHTGPSFILLSNLGGAITGAILALVFKATQARRFQDSEIDPEKSTT